jgi:outer membrane protein OmpA-like peptidoglycan-associated protein
VEEFHVSWVFNKRVRRRDDMKKLVAFALIAAMMSVAGAADAAKVWDDMSWWGNSGATPDPVADSKGRSGYWWWPKDPDAVLVGEGTCCPQIASSGDDSDLWGNRGVVFSQWQKPEPVEPPEDNPPVDPPCVERSVPTFSHVLFDFDKSTLKAEGKAELNKLVAELKKNAKDTVLIEGHTCSVGAEAYNMGLGQRRADAVKAYLVESGIAAARVSTQSLGETQPAVANDTPANRKLNRRAVFKQALGEKKCK